MDEALMTPRQHMLGDLVERHLLGKSRGAILQVLGTSSSKMDPDGDGSALSYPTGFERGSYVRIDSEWLIIYFDSLETAIRYAIRTD